MTGWWSFTDQSLQKCTLQVQTQRESALKRLSNRRFTIQPPYLVTKESLLRMQPLQTVLAESMMSVLVMLLSSRWQLKGGGSPSPHASSEKRRHCIHVPAGQKQNEIVHIFLQSAITKHDNILALQELQ